MSGYIQQDLVGLFDPATKQQVGYIDANGNEALVSGAGIPSVPTLKRSRTGTKLFGAGEMQAVAASAFGYTTAGDIITFATMLDIGSTD